MFIDFLQREKRLRPNRCPHKTPPSLQIVTKRLLFNPSAVNPGNAHCMVNSGFGGMWYLVVFARGILDKLKKQAESGIFVAGRRTNETRDGGIYKNLEQDQAGSTYSYCGSSALGFQTICISKFIIAII